MKCSTSVLLHLLFFLTAAHIALNGHCLGSLMITWDGAHPAKKKVTPAFHSMAVCTWPQRIKQRIFSNTTADSFLAGAVSLHDDPQLLCLVQLSCCCLEGLLMCVVLSNCIGFRTRFQNQVSEPRTRPAY